MRALISLLVFLTVYVPHTIADEQAEAQRIIKAMEDLYRGNASRANMTMRVKTPQYERRMSMVSESLGEELMLIRILSPKKDRGITSLRREKEMWNYFPKINKVIKVPPSMMMGSWMGSDFTNDDLVKETTLIEEYALSLDETDELYTITLLPKAKTVTVWGKMEISVRKDNLHPVERVFYDDDGTKVRVMTYREPKRFGNQILPSVMEMVPLNKEGHRTLVIYETLELNVEDVQEETFTLRHLKKRFR